MQHTIKTNLSEEQTRKAFDMAMSKYGEDFKAHKPVITWADGTHGSFSFQTHGMKIQGEIEVKANSLQVKLINLPFMARLAAPKIVKVVEEEVLRWADKVRQEA